MKRVIFYAIALIVVGVILFIKKQKSDEVKTFNRAATLSVKEEYDAAIPLLKKLVRKNPKNLKFLKALAECYFHANKWDDGISTDERILKLSPNDDEAKLRIEQNKHNIKMEQEQNEGKSEVDGKKE